MLDDKLKEILYEEVQIPAQNFHHNWSPDELESALSTEANEAIAQLKQAFQEAGWQAPGAGLRGNSMTGQEWYERFEKELDKDTDHLMCGSKIICSNHVKEAAERASGISEPQIVINKYEGHRSAYAQAEEEARLYSDSSGSDMWPDTSPNAKERVTKL